MTNSLIPSLQETRHLLKEASIFLLFGFALAGAPMVLCPPVSGALWPFDGHVHASGGRARPGRR